MLCCYPAVAAAAVLLLAAAVRYRVPDGKNCCWFIESDPSAFFLSIQTRFIFDVPLGSTVSYLRPRFAYILGSHGHAWSHGGRQPDAAKPPYIPVYKKRTCWLLCTPQPMNVIKSVLEEDISMAVQGDNFWMLISRRY